MSDRDTEFEKAEFQLPAIRLPDPLEDDVSMKFWWGNFTLSRAVQGESCAEMRPQHERNILWTFEDMRMLIGNNMPIFGGGKQPCVSLKLRYSISFLVFRSFLLKGDPVFSDMRKPINVLTGMDYWLDQLMCNVPEVMMCYHLSGIVQVSSAFC